MRLVIIFLFVSFTLSFARDKPNVIFILADDLGFKELGSYGQKKIRTPHLDKLAEDGMRFTRNYSEMRFALPHDAF
jgi:arylsulfatase A-like enzyme